MKICQHCLVEKPLEEFSKKTKAKDGLQPWCKLCNKERSKQYYKDNSEAHRTLMNARNRAAVARNQEYLGEYLSTHPCVDCGNSDIRVLEFDHIGDNDKLCDVSYLVRNTFSVATLAKEIAKCEVRCANCHRIITVTRANSWRQRFFTDRL